MANPTPPQNDVVDRLLGDLIAEIDYDIYKQFIPEFSEDPEWAEERWERLRSIVASHIDIGEGES